MFFSTCENDSSIGPGVSNCRDGFDFTIAFELLFFTIIPSSIFIVLSLQRTVLLTRRHVIVNAPALQLAKLGLITSYVGLELALLILVGVRSFGVTGLSIASTVLQFIAALCMVALSFLEHSRSPRPSVLLSFYLFLTLLFDVAETRTFWLASGTKAELTYTSMFTATIALKAVILLLEAQHKTKWVSWDNKEPHSPEETTGIFGLGVYFWLNNLFVNGYHKVLQINDLYPLDHAMKGKLLHEQFERHIDYAKLKEDKHGLLKVLARTLLGPLLMPIIPRLAMLGFTFCQPFFINSLLTYLSENPSTASKNVAYGFIGASVFIYAGIAISTAFYMYLHRRMLQMGRGSLVSAIYAKATKARTMSGEDSSALTLMSTDLERIRLGFQSIHDLWASLIEIGLSSWLLYGQLGAAFVVPIAVVSCCFLALSVLVRYTGDSQRSWMACAQKRVGLTATVIANMKNLKISGLTTPVATVVQKLRTTELKAAGRYRHLVIYSALFGYIPLFVSPVITFATAKGSLDTTKIFTSLSYLLLLANPLSQLFQSIPTILAAVASVGRIQKYLESETRDDTRMLKHDAIRDSEKWSSKSGTIPTLDSQRSSVITITDGYFGWEAEKMVLHDVNVEIPKSSLTIICGPIASGKSTLTRAILGEVPISKGSITLSTSFRRVAYCDQTPFLSNNSIKDNIVGFTPFDSVRYSEVINATLLDVDFKTLPLGDRTNVGSNGITLSGGQKQRVSLARALYLQSDLLVLDDVFSGLDADTEEQVFRKVFGPEGIVKRRQATAIICTHSVRHLPAASHIIALGTNGRVVEQGSWSQLSTNDVGYVQSLGVKESGSDNASRDVNSDADVTKSEPELLRRTTTVSSAVSEADKARQLGDRTVYKHYFRSMGYSVAGSLFLSGASFGFFYNFPTVWLKFWTDDIAMDQPSHSNAYYVGIYGLLNMCCLLSLLSLGFLLFIVAISRSGANLHRDALSTLIKAPLLFFTATDQGQIVNLFSQDLNLVDTELPNSLLNSLFTIFVAIGQAAVLATSSPYMAISYPLLFALLWVVQKFYLRTSRQLRLLDLEAKSPLYTHFLDTMKGIVTLRAFGFISENIDLNSQLLDASQRPAYLLQMVQNWLFLVLGLVVMVMAVVLTSLAVLSRSGSGFTGASLVTLMGFGDMLSGIVLQLTQLETSIGAVSRLRTFTNTVKPEDKEDEDIMPVEEWPQNGVVELKGVSASYGLKENKGEQSQNSNVALRCVHLNIIPGEKVAICGRTGSGKSSLIALLLKLLEPVAETATNVYIDNIALHRIDRLTLRQRIIAIPQDAVFLPDGSTFQKNLDPFEVASPADCRSVLETVDLWTFVQERGGLEAGMSAGTFSQGQRQLFSLARAVLKRRVRARSLGFGDGASEGGVLLLDEVSSSVDRETERAMQEIIQDEFKAYTVLAVSHHLDMIFGFDRVVVMDKGEVVEVGNPKTLSEDPSTRFGELWRAGGN